MASNELYGSNTPRYLPRGYFATYTTLNSGWENDGANALHFHAQVENISMHQSSTFTHIGNGQLHYLF